MNAPPMIFRWDAEAEVMRPLPHFRKRANTTYVDECDYRLAPVEERSDISHRHEFAWLKEAWSNLPEAIADLYPSVEHLRKRALIEAGFYTEDIVDAGSNAAALRVSATVRHLDEFALVIVRGPAVVIRRAKSQSYRSMNREEFQASKDGIIGVVATMLGVTPAELAKAEAA